MTSIQFLYILLTTVINIIFIICITVIHIFLHIILHINLILFYILNKLLENTKCTCCKSYFVANR